ncbi:MAG: prolyl oligopeptidase family serine peptidase [Clostridiales bacterium]|jgi:alpha-beta hydrolase superfamily lysophospholipase|nr:prolyl oligopeptidase family serine peptidase [Clostridiales bacterium]
MAIIEITKDSFGRFAFTNEKALKEPIKLVYVDFHGMGMHGVDRRTEIYPHEILMAEAGILQIYTYCGPWHFMNDNAVKTVDEILDAAFEKYNLPGDFPIVSSGGSMGGYCALMYPRLTTAHRAVAVAALCPVCDLLAIAPYIADALYSTFAHTPVGIDAELKRHSPLLEAENLPHVPYFIAQGDADTAVDKEKHSDKLVAKMKSLGFDVEYLEVAGADHALYTSLPTMKSYLGFIRRFAKE